MISQPCSSASRSATQVVAGIDGVHPGRRCGVAAAVEPRHRRPAGRAGDQPARLVRVLLDGPGDDVVDDLLPAAPARPGTVAGRRRTLTSPMSQPAMLPATAPRRSPATAGRATTTPCSTPSRPGSSCRAARSRACGSARSSWPTPSPAAADGELWLEGVHIAAVPVRQRRRRPRSRTAAASCSCTATRSTACRPASPRSAWRSCRCGCTSATAGRRSSSAVGKGRQKGDKRQAIAERDSQREIERALGRHRKGME